MPCRPLVVLTLLPVLLLAPRAAPAGEPLLANGDFARWDAGAPSDWTVGEGARTDGEVRLSRIEPLDGGGVALAGDAGTTRWSILTQRIDPAFGPYVELSCKARVLGYRKEPGQYGSCYVGVLHRNAAGRPRDFTYRRVRNEAWQDERIPVAVPPGAGAHDVAIFLSGTGRLEVRDVRLRALAPEESFDVLVADMDRNYSFFAAHGIDWQALAARHADAARKAQDPAAFAAAVAPMLAALDDMHVWLQTPDGRRLPASTPSEPPNFEIEPLVKRLTGTQQVIRNVLAGRTAEGFGYLALGTMQGSETQFQAIEKALRGLFDAPALILDLRVNGGGQEAWGQRLCGLLAAERVLYGRSKLRSGPAHDAFHPGGERWVVPRTDAPRFGGPVAVLIGPACVSSGEGMALMAKALPQATLVGLPTRGASGSPAPVHLPNGVSVWYSRWISLLPDGTGFERHGIEPDVRVEHVPGDDKTLDEAVRLLEERLSTQKATGKQAPR